MGIQRQLGPGGSNNHSADKPFDEIIVDLQGGRHVTENFQIVFERYHAPVLRLFERHGLLSEDASDLAQEVFLAAHQSIGELRDPSQFAGWLFSIARNALRNEFERRKAKKRFGFKVLIESASGPLETNIVESLPDRSRSNDILGQMLHREKVGKLIAELRELPSQMRHCVHLRVIENSTYKEIAVTMGLSINTVKAHLHQARKALREKRAVGENLSGYTD